MTIVELYTKTPVARHPEIIVSGKRVFFEDEEYVLQPNENLILVHSDKELKQKLTAIEAKLKEIKP